MLTSFDSKNHENIILCYLKQNKTWDPYSSSVNCAKQLPSFLSHPHFSTPQSHLTTSWMTSSELHHWMPGRGIVPQSIGCRPAAKQDDYCLTHYHLVLQNACHPSQSSCLYNGDICGLSYLGEGNSKCWMCSFYLFFIFWRSDETISGLVPIYWESWHSGWPSPLSLSPSRFWLDSQQCYKI